MHSYCYESLLEDRKRDSSSKNVLASFTLKYRSVLCTKLLNELTSHMDLGAFWSLKAPNTRISYAFVVLNVQHQLCAKHLLLCSAEERKSYALEQHEGECIFIFG